MDRTSASTGSAPLHLHAVLANTTRKAGRDRQGGYGPHHRGVLSAQRQHYHVTPICRTCAYINRPCIVAPEMFARAQLPFAQASAPADRKNFSTRAFAKEHQLRGPVAVRFFFSSP